MTERELARQALRYWASILELQWGRRMNAAERSWWLAALNAVSQPSRSDDCDCHVTLARDALELHR